KQDVAASFQKSVVDVLVEKTFRAAKNYNVNQLIIAGGVAANSGLRAGVEERFKDSELQILIPPITLCTDNAAMIAAAARSEERREGHKVTLCDIWRQKQ